MTDIKEFLHETFKENVMEETRVVYRYKPAEEDELSSDSIERKRAIKRWKNSLNYFYQNPEKFRFGLKDF